MIHDICMQLPAKGKYQHQNSYRAATNNGTPCDIPDSVNEVFRYEPETGKLFWRDPFITALSSCGKLFKRPRRNDGEAGSVSLHSTSKLPRCRRVKYLGHDYGVHRIIYFMAYGYCPEVLDHIDGNPLNNRLENLRPAFPVLNSWNQKKFKNNTTGITGVNWDKRRKQWRARITVKGVVHELGFTSSKFEAACLRKSAELEMFGYYLRDV